MAVMTADGLTRAWTQLNYHPTQSKLFQTILDGPRFCTVPAGRGSGKTEIAMRRLVMALADEKPWPDPRYFLAGPTITHIRDIAWDRILELIPSDWHAEKPMRSKDAMIIRTKFGSTLQLFGLDGKRCRIEGRQWDGGVIDESCDCQPGVFDRAILPALSWRNAWCWRIGVPKRTGIGAAEFREYHEQALTGEHKDRAAFWWPASDIIPAELLEDAKASLDPKDYDEQFNAQFVSAGGASFWAFDEVGNVAPCQYDKRAPLVVGCDFNRDPMAWAIGHRYENRLEWFDELFIHDANTRQAMDRLWDRYGSRHEGRYEFYCDAAGGQRKTSATRNVSGEINTDLLELLNDDRFKKSPGGRIMPFPRVKPNGKLEANPRVATRFSETNALLLNANGERRMIIDPRCKRLIDDMQFRASEDSVGMIGHISDAVGYTVHRLFPIRLAVRQKAKGAVIMKRGAA